AQVLGDDHALAALRRIVLLDAHIALQFTPLGALATQRLQCADAALVARAPRLDARADPDFLGGEAFVEAGVLLGLGMQPLLATAQVVLPVTRPHRELAAIDLDDAGSHCLQEGAVMADEDD